MLVLLFLRCNYFKNKEFFLKFQDIYTRLSKLMSNLFYLVKGFRYTTKTFINITRL